MLVAASPRFLTAAPTCSLADSLHALPAQIGDWTVDSSTDSAVQRLVELDSEFVGAYPGSEVRRFASVDDELIRDLPKPARHASGALRRGAAADRSRGRSLPAMRGTPWMVWHPLSKSRSIREASNSASLSRANPAPSAVSFSGTTSTGDLCEMSIRRRCTALGRAEPAPHQRRGRHGRMDEPQWSAVRSARTEALGFVEALVPTLRRQLPS